MASEGCETQFTSQEEVMAKGKKHRKVGKKGKGKLKIHPAHAMGKTLRKKSRRKKA
jgi:hypothetical protein